jgi:transposase
MNDLSQLKPKLVRLKLSGVLETLEQRIAQAMEEKWEYSQFLLNLLTDEVIRRDNRQLTLRVGRSGLNPEKTIASFDFSFNKHIHKPTIRELATCSFIEQRRNLFFVGPSGVGKSHLSQALGNEACLKNIDVMYRPTVSHFGAGWIFLRPPAGCTGGLCMMLDLTGLEIYVRPGITDMRKQVNGLSEIVEQQMNRSAMSGSLFLFCNRDRRLIKCVYWDRNGFCLWLKRLEKDRFPWPNTEEQARQITTGELGMLLDGIDFWHAHTTLQYAECN